MRDFVAPQETRERVKLLRQLADSLVEQGHFHASSIKQWVSAVDNRYKDFSTRMDKYRFVQDFSHQYILSFNVTDLLNLIV